MGEELRLRGAMIKVPSYQVAKLSWSTLTLCSFGSGIARGTRNGSCALKAAMGPMQGPVLARIRKEIQRSWGG